MLWGRQGGRRLWAGAALWQPCPWRAARPERGPCPALPSCPAASAETAPSVGRLGKGKVGFWHCSLGWKLRGEKKNNNNKHKERTNQTSTAQKREGREGWGKKKPTPHKHKANLDMSDGKGTLVTEGGKGRGYNAVLLLTSPNKVDLGTWWRMPGNRLHPNPRRESFTPMLLGGLAQEKTTPSPERIKALT